MYVYMQNFSCVCVYLHIYVYLNMYIYIYINKYCLFTKRRNNPQIPRL